MPEIKFTHIDTHKPDDFMHRIHSRIQRALQIHGETGRKGESRRLLGAYRKERDQSPVR